MITTFYHYDPWGGYFSPLHIRKREASHSWFLPAQTLMITGLPTHEEMIKNNPTTLNLTIGAGIAYATEIPNKKEGRRIAKTNTITLLATVISVSVGLETTHVGVKLGRVNGVEKVIHVKYYKNMPYPEITAASGFRNNKDFLKLSQPWALSNNGASTWP